MSDLVLPMGGIAILMLAIIWFLIREWRAHDARVVEEEEANIYGPPDAKLASVMKPSIYLNANTIARGTDETQMFFEAPRQAAYPDGGGKKEKVYSEPPSYRESEITYSRDP